MESTTQVEGQLNQMERKILMDAVYSIKPKHVLEVGTWLGGGSTLHILKALQQNGEGHLWGIEAFESIYERMLANIGSAGPEIAARFTPLFGFSDAVIPKFLADQGVDFRIEMAFLDGGDNPQEQIDEFLLLDPVMPVGAALFSHDIKLRKGKWLKSYLEALDHWQCKVHDISDEGLFQAVKVRENPSPESRKRARKVYFQCRLELVELVGRWLPKSVCSFGLKLMPRKLFNKITQGR